MPCAGNMEESLKWRVKKELPCSVFYTDENIARENLPENTLYLAISTSTKQCYCKVYCSRQKTDSLTEIQVEIGI